MKERFKPVGPRIKVKVKAPDEERTESGIYLNPIMDKTEDNEIGVIVNLGHLAYVNFEQSGPWAKIGDTVLFQRYAGKPREEIEVDGSIGYYRILKDVDIIAVLENEDK